VSEKGSVGTQLRHIILALEDRREKEKEGEREESNNQRFKDLNAAIK
jgi:hypothetical protein